MTVNEWYKAQQLAETYWLYVVAEGVPVAMLAPHDFTGLFGRVELVGSRQGFFEVEEAWHYLFTKGYGNIKLLVAQTDQKCLRPLHPLVRLSG